MNKRLLPIFLVVFIDLVGFGIIIPLLPTFAISFNASPLAIGLLTASYSAMQLIGAPVLGRVSDRLGRKPLLIFSQLGTLAGFVLMGFANSLPLLFAARFLLHCAAPRAESAVLRAPARVAAGAAGHRKVATGLHSKAASRRS